MTSAEKIKPTLSCNATLSVGSRNKEASLIYRDNQRTDLLGNGHHQKYHHCTQVVRIHLVSPIHIRNRAHSGPHPPNRPPCPRPPCPDHRRVRIAYQGRSRRQLHQEGRLLQDHLFLMHIRIRARKSHRRSHRMNSQQNNRLASNHAAWPHRPT